MVEKKKRRLGEIGVISLAHELMLSSKTNMQFTNSFRSVLPIS